MPEDNIKALIINGCLGDVLSYRNYLNKKLGHNDYEFTNQYSYIVEILILTIKSLSPSSDEVRSVIDYKRFQEELKLWKDYKHGGNSSLLNFNDTNSEIYWEKNDNSVYSRIFPIILSNNYYEYIKDEVIKNILFTTGNIKIFLEGVILSKILYILINEKKDYDNLILDVKEEIINLSQKDIIGNYNNCFKVDIKTYPGNFKLDFERKRIDVINLLNDIKVKDYDLLQNIFNILRGDIKNIEDVKPNFLSYALWGFLYNNIEETSLKDCEFIENLCGYLYKLRKGRISPETLKIDKYILPDIFKFNIGDEFYHSLLNKCIVIKKNENENNIKSIVQTKSGNYEFIKIKHP